MSEVQLAEIDGIPDRPPAGRPARRERRIDPSRLAPVRVAYSGPAQVHLVAPDGRRRTLEVDLVEFGPTGAEVVSVTGGLDPGVAVRLTAQLPSRWPAPPVELSATVRSCSEVEAADLVLGRSAYRCSLSFDSLTFRQEAQLIAAAFFLQTRHRRPTSQRL